MRKKVFFGSVTTLLFFGLIEVALRLTGFQAESRVERMEFSFPVDDYNKSAPQRYLQRDDTLFWKPVPGALGHNAKGFYGPEFDAEKPAGVYRIVCLGDSCTHFGPISYPDILRSYLEKQAPGRFEVINASCIGYTSYQGRTLLQQQVLDWSPDLVTVYFGWNDHWLARGLEDKDQAAAKPIAGVGLLDSMRIVQLARTLKSGNVRPASKMRVRMDDYADNLTAIGSLNLKGNAETWYLTAPHALDLGIPPYLYTSGEISNPAGLIPLHRAYNQTVCDVAELQNASLIDLESEMDAMDKRELFIEDHIHLSERGRLYVASRLVETLRQRGVLGEE